MIREAKNKILKCQWELARLGMVKVNGYGVFLSSFFFFPKTFHILCWQNACWHLWRDFTNIYLNWSVVWTKTCFTHLIICPLVPTPNKISSKLITRPMAVSSFAYILLLFYVLCLILFGSFFLFLNKFHLFHVACSQIYTTNMIML